MISVHEGELPCESVRSERSEQETGTLPHQRSEAECRLLLCSALHDIIRKSGWQTIITETLPIKRSRRSGERSRNGMAIYVTGDTHGSRSDGFFTVDGFMSRLSIASFPEQKGMGKEDYVVICGDFGGVWDANRFRFRESPEEKAGLDWLDRKPFTTLFVPGNHENYDRLTGCADDRLMDSWFYAKMPPEEKARLRQGYPRREWNGGHVRVLRPSVMMLERGDIFSIDGRYCFAFGGARSHDIRDGILDPADYPDEVAFKKAYKARRGRMFRVRGVSWWAAEMPSREEKDRGRKNVEDFMAGHEQIDFVFTHDAPAADKICLGYDGIDELNLYLESLRDIMRYGQWFYGHLHDNRRVSDKSCLLYEQILRIS